LIQQAVKTMSSSRVLSRLGKLSAGQGLNALAARLLDLTDFVENDLESIEHSLEEIELPDALIGRTAGHLMDIGGKRMRPLCVALAARMGKGFDDPALHLAVAVELVHNATLLHDDVVDASAARRGAPTARSEYGNAASIFAGDWLLIEALRRVRRASIPGLMESLLATIDEMILAESLQLEHRGSVTTDRSVYLAVAEGKTAALFRWAMAAGGKAGGLDGASCEQLSHFGRHLGVAFQVIDDLLDLTGDTETTGKALFTDLREGMVTYPLILAMERRPELRSQLTAVIGFGDGGAPQELCQEVVQAVLDSGAVDECRTFARHRCELAIRSLEGLPDGRSKRTLRAVAEATVNRQR